MRTSSILSLLLIGTLSGSMLLVSGRESQTTFSAEPVLTLPDSLQQAQLGIIGTTLKIHDSNSWDIISKDGKSQGILLSSEKVGKRFEGYMGPTPVFILVDPQNKVKKIVSGYNDETPDFYEMAEQELFPKWIGLDAKAGEKVKVDAVSGATFSSNAIIINILNALEAYNLDEK